MKFGVLAIYDVDVHTAVLPQRLLAAATDFTDHRPDLWPNINRKQFRVYSLGDHTADVEEGTAPVHHRYRYQWSDDGVVRATTIDATAMTTGSIWELRIRPSPSGGSDIRIHVEMGFKGPIGMIGRLVMGLTGGGAETYRKWFMKTVAVLEAEGPATRNGAK